jgi:hypothetical protein
MKGQAALEYLMMYGWALVIVLVIMAILYTTIFKPEFYIVEKCDTAPDIECIQNRIKLTVKNDGTDLVFDLANSMGYDIELKNISFYPEGMTNNEYLITCMDGRCTNCKCINSGCNCLSKVAEPKIRNGETKRFGVLMYNVYADVDKIYRIKFVINYNITETGTIHRTAGVISARASREG